ncbi:MAG: hypothetical protein ACT4PT_09395 [Methanobacteriota archaeon]
MRLPALFILLVPLAFSGCLGGADETPVESSSTTDVTTGIAAPALEPVVQFLEGHQTSMALSRLAHNQATEPMVAELQREGTVMTVAAAPESMRVELEWTSPSPATQMGVMIDTPHPDENKLHTFFVGMSDTSPICFEMPAEVLQHSVGEWAIMIHNFVGTEVDYKITFTSVGGDAVLQTDRFHMEVEDDTKERDEAKPVDCA